MMIIIIVCIVDYKTENFDDSDLQSRLYAEIYYEPNNEGETETLDISRTIQFASMVAELNIEPESMQQKPEDKQPLEFEGTRDKSNKAKKISKPSSNESSVIEPLMYNDTLHAQNSADCPPSVVIQTNTDELSGREMNPVIHEHDNTNNDNAGNLSVEEEKKCKESVAKKHKSSNYTKSKHQENSPNDHTASLNETKHSKYNVLSKSIKQEMSLAKQSKKDKETSDSSDSEESIFEVPVPPKPTPPLINLPDSDEENNTNSGMDDQILEKVTSARRYKIIGTSSSHQDISFKNKSTDKSLHNKSTTINPRNTHMQEIREDIVLNCTIVQKSAKSISEIKQLSKSAELNKSQGDVSTEDTNQYSTQQLLQNTSKENNTNCQQEIYVTPGRHTRTQQNIDESNMHCRYNLRSLNKNKTDVKVSCRNSDTTIDRKRQYDIRIENPQQKRQCIVQNNQDVIQQSSSDEGRRNESRNEYFKSMPDTLRNYYYNSSRGQENFDVGELQRGMSKDPRMWMIMDEDLMPCPPSRQRNRFWNVRCSNCQRDGHQRYDCPVPRRTPCCYICGEKGHVESRCPQKICLTCGKHQNTFRKTCEYCRVLHCTMCDSIGHESTQCPDLWRRYHQTTDMSSAPQNPGTVMKSPGSLHCCNCTKRGHESSMCREYRWSQHFQTPAAVTNYMDGPMYTYATSFSDDTFEEDILSFKATSSRSISHSSKNIQQTMEEHSKFSTNVDTLSSSTTANETSILQETLHNSEIEGNLESSSMVNKMLRPEEKQKKYRQNEIEFTTIICSYGKFRDKYNKNARIISRNLFKNDLSCYGKKTIISSLPNRKVSPFFLKTLFEKAIEFEVKIGSTIYQRQPVVIQLIAMKEYVELIYDLLIHWINLPDNEKDYGMDVTLPMSPTKMFNLLSSRMPQLTKMNFTCYNEHIKGMNDPRWLFNSIKRQKAIMEEHNGTKREYFRLRKKLWRVQVKLLMIVNTEPKPNVYISEFRNAMNQLEFEKRNQMIEKLDSATYLKLTLLYNRLFVPHTPVALFKTLRRIEKYAEMAKNMNCSPQMLQEFEKNEMREQENLASYVNVSSLLPSATSCTSQNINSAENPSAINIQQSTSNETLIEKRNVIDISPKISDTINCNEDEIMIIENSVAQDSQIMSLITEVFDEPISIPTEDKNEGQLSTSSVKIECKASSASKQNVIAKHLEKLTKGERRRIRKVLECKNVYPNALDLIKEARMLKVPHMISAAEELQKKVSNGIIKPKHVRKMRKMVNLEKRYQKNVSLYWKNLKKE